MVQGIFDDENEPTQVLWRYPDTGVWDPERNTAKFVQAMPEWQAHGNYRMPGRSSQTAYIRWDAIPSDGLSDIELSSVTASFIDTLQG